MSKLCQGPSCHMYDTTDRKRGPKGNKRNITRTVNGYGYGDKNFCTLGCQDDWSKEYMTRAVDYFGRLTQPKAMTPENSWTKRERYSWERDEHENFKSKQWEDKQGNPCYNFWDLDAEHPRTAVNYSVRKA